MDDDERKHSIRWQLILLVLICIVLPIAIIIGVMNYVLSVNINSQVVKTVTTSVANEIASTSKRLNEAVTVSRKASYDGEIGRAYNRYLKSEDINALHTSVTNYIKQVHKKNDMFLGTFIFFTDAPQQIYYTYNDADAGGSYESVLRYKKSAHDIVVEKSKKLTTDICIMQIGGSTYMIRNILNSSFEPYAAIIMELDMEVIFGGIRDILWAKTVTVWLDEHELTLLGEPATQEQKQRVFSGDDYYEATEIYGTKEILAGKLSYLITVDGEVFHDSANNFQDVIIALIILVIPFILIMLWFFYRNITRPIDNLIVAAKKIEQGAWGVQVNEDARNSEFEYLNVAFNSMSARLKRQFDTSFGEELALRDAKIMALQCQINPHFLNNTLEIINWEARLTDNVKISKMIEALSVMLDAAMDRCKKPLVHLYEEMMYVDSYLYIISERFGKRLTIEKDIDRSLLDINVPLLILQPILENAVTHGIELNQTGTIVIRAYRDGLHLILEIENDGKMTAADEQYIAQVLSNKQDKKKRTSGSLGIYNVNQRIKMIYGEDCGLSIKMNTNGHTVAQIIVNIS